MKAFSIILLLLVLTACQKTKLKDEYSILEGKWKWVNATEARTSLSSGNTTYNNYAASEYPDEYFIEFDRKGMFIF